MNLLALFILLGSAVGSVLFCGGVLQMMFIKWTTGLATAGIGSAIIITILVAMVCYMWEVYHK